MTTNTFEEALRVLFPEASNVEKTFSVAGVAFGTVEIEGVAYDWFEGVDSFRFIPA